MIVIVAVDGDPILAPPVAFDSVTANVSFPS
jgi:hypothetical protein